MLVLNIVMYVVVGVLFTAFAALVLSGLTLLAGKISPHFEMAGPEEWTFREFYVRYLIIAAVFAFVAIVLSPLLGCFGLLIGMFALIVAYKHVFNAEWPQALVLGAMGGAISLMLFVFIMVLILQPLGLIEDPAEQEEFGRQSRESLTEPAYPPNADRGAALSGRTRGAACGGEAIGLMAVSRNVGRFSASL